MGRFSSILLLLGGLTMVALTGQARAERDVVVNGLRLSSEQIAELERINCGPIPNGKYWLGHRSGVWGYAGNPAPQGHIADNCRKRPPSLSERGMIYDQRFRMLGEEPASPAMPHEVRREESEIGTTSQPHAPTLQENPQ